MLGAGTLLVAADAARRLSSLRGQEARVLALLSAAYNRAVPPSVLGNIERAAKSWRDGDDSLAYIHLAHARLPELQEPHTAAQRLFLADELMKAGGKPRTIFEILDLDAAFIDALRSANVCNQYGPVPEGTAHTRDALQRRPLAGRSAIRMAGSSAACFPEGGIAIRPGAISPDLVDEERAETLSRTGTRQGWRERNRPKIRGLCEEVRQSGAQDPKRLRRATRQPRGKRRFGFLRRLPALDRHDGRSQRGICGGFEIPAG